MLTPRERQAILAGLTEAEQHELLYTWDFWSRPEQLPPPGDWRTWLCLSGRGWGKTRTGTEWVRAQIESGRCRRMALVGPTAADARDVIVEGESGLLSVCPPWNRPTYEPTKRRLTWANGAMAITYSADEPERLRGPQHDGAYCDEVAVWRRPEAWDMLLFGLRLGDDPRVVVTTTPRPVKLIRDLIAQPTTVITKGTSYENKVNLAPGFFDGLVDRYAGTRLGRQELLAELLTDNPYALWKRDDIDAARVTEPPVELSRVVVGIDPAVTANEDSDETGIVAAGKGTDGHYYILADRSLRATPHRWAAAAIALYHACQGDRIVAEQNQGGLMVQETLHNVDPSVPVKLVSASRGKLTRAEPIAALYEQGKCHHCGAMPELEDQLCEWVPGDPSPDRLDALVWAMTDLSQGTSWMPIVLSGTAREINAGFSPDAERSFRWLNQYGR